MQVGYVGLVAAVSKFDRAFGSSLVTFARPHITGEINALGYFRPRPLGLDERASAS